MEQLQEHRQLEHYASVAKSKILTNQSDLDPKDHALPAMLSWCRRQIEPIVVLKSGIVLTSKPSSRIVQNCKIVMLNKELKFKQVFPATSTLISILLENAVDEDESTAENKNSVSTQQQQRLRLLVKEALDIHATDIHIEVRQSMARIRFRKHGELFLHAEWLPKLAREVISVAFNKETDHAVTHFNPLVPQNASMPLSIADQQVRLRLASLPAQGGFDVVLRILTTQDEQNYTLKELGYLPDQIKVMRRAVSLPSGAVIVSGPTGSGKTTTLASCMHMVDDIRKIYTIEDPVEKHIEGATQIPVNTEHYDRSFASMARTVLRMDPDVVVLGEMRDEDTAQVMLRAAITGHLVFSTVHTHSATAIVTRLIDLGVSTSLLSSPSLLSCLVCQRLVPLLCHHCAKPLSGSLQHTKHLERWSPVLSDAMDHVKVRGVTDCRRCHGLGIAGRTVVAEIIWIDEAGRRYIQQNDILGWENNLRQNGWISYAERLLDLVKQGSCDPLDAEKLIGELGIEFHAAKATVHA